MMQPSCRIFALRRPESRRRSDMGQSGTEACARLAIFHSNGMRNATAVDTTGTMERGTVDAAGCKRMEIHWIKLDSLASAQKREIEARLQALAEGHSDLIDLRIAARSDRHHRHGGKSVRITCEVRGDEIVAGKTRADLGLALDEALDAFEREVRRLRDRRATRRLRQPPEPPCLGIVDRIFREDGYGFIVTDSGEQVYFHRNALKRGLRFDHLDEGHRVALNLEAGDEGLQASVVYPPPPGLGAP